MKIVPDSQRFDEANTSSTNAHFGKGKLGTGSRFAACEASGKSKALCAYIGRRAYGGKAMAKMAAKGK
jgi:hypothetical protein